MISIVVPTIDEAANLPELARRIDAAMAGRAYELLVVDDASRDGTPEVCRELAQRYPLRLVVRSKPIGGLSGAVLEGFAHARGDNLVVMDGDLQHPPEAIPAILAPLLSDQADFVLGSRWVAGGRVTASWGLPRRLNARIARLLAAPLAGRVSDPMSGYFAIRRDCCARAAILAPVGYKIALELMCRCRPNHVVEVPIQFGPRAAGRSKLSITQRVNYLRHLARLCLIQPSPPESGTHAPARRALAEPIVRAVIAVVLLAACGLKAGQFFTRDSLPSAWDAAQLLGASVVEGLLGIWLLSGLAPVAARRTAIIVLAAFALVAGRHVLAGHEDCGCFGSVRMNPRLTVGFDSGAVLALTRLGGKSRGRARTRNMLDRPLHAQFGLATSACMSLAIVSAALLVGWRQAHGVMASTGAVVFDVNSWMGKRCPLLDFVDRDTGAEISRGTAVVLLVNSGCGECKSYMQRRKAIIGERLYVADLAAGDANAAELPSHSRFSPLRLRPGAVYAADVPSEVWLAGGTVVEIRRPRE